MAGNRDDDKDSEEPSPPEGGGREPPGQHRRTNNDATRPPKKHSPLIMTLSVVGVLVLLCAGAGGYFFVREVGTYQEQLQRNADISEVGSAYRAFFKQKGRPPANLEELETFHGRPGQGFRMIRDGKLEILWDVTLSDQLPPANTTLLAWETQPDFKGKRVVLYTSATSVVVPEEEFAKLTKALPNRKAQRTVAPAPITQDQCQWPS
jgi:hypothetical protein